MDTSEYKPPIKDWNDFLVADFGEYPVGSEEDKAAKHKMIQDMIDQAEVFEPPAIGYQTAANGNGKNGGHSGALSSNVQSQMGQSLPFTQRQEGVNRVFSFTDVDYRLSGLKDQFTASLRINIKAELKADPSVKHYDNLDLYSARSRRIFAHELAGILGLEPRRIERDLMVILEYLEAERDKKALALPKDGESVNTPEQERIGGEFLDTDDILGEIDKDMTKLGYVGEKWNKIITYLVATSRLMDKPLSAIIASQSAAGKSMLASLIEILMPPESVLAISSFSDKALNYTKNIMHKLLSIGEAVHNEEIDYQLREIQSKQHLSRMVTVVDPRTAVKNTEIQITEIIAAIITTTTRDHAINAENATRSLFLNTDESAEQTARIHYEQRRKYSFERYAQIDSEIPKILEKHHAAQRMLKQYRITIPFWEFLEYPAGLMRTRRDHDRFLEIMAVICFLRQRKKEIILINGHEYIEVDLADYRLAYEIMVSGVLMSSITDLPGGALDLYEKIRVFCRNRAIKEDLRSEEVSFTQREIREHCGYGQSWLQEHLRMLVNYEYVILIKGGSARSKGVYRLLGNDPIQKLEAASILSPEALEKKIREDGEK